MPKRNNRIATSHRGPVVKYVKIKVRLYSDVEAVDTRYGENISESFPEYRDDKMLPRPNKLSIIPVSFNE